MSKIYLVYGSRGSHSDYSEWNLKAFRTLESAERHLKRAEDYLLENGLFEKTEEETKWGRKVTWRRTEAWVWGEWELVKKLDKVAKENPLDLGKEDSDWSWFNGYFVDEIKLED